MLTRGLISSKTAMTEFGEVQDSVRQDGGDKPFVYFSVVLKIKSDHNNSRAQLAFVPSKAEIVLVVRLTP